MSSTDYSQKVMDIIKQAQRLAVAHKNTEVTDLHLTSVILNEDKNSVVTLLLDRGIVLVDLLDQLERALNKLPQPKGVKNLYVSRDYQRVLLVSEQISRQQFEGAVSLDHLFLALLKDEDLASAKLLKRYGIDYDSYLKALAKRENDKLSQGISQSDLDILMKYGRNLTQEAQRGELDPIIGRDEETRAVIRILSRRIKNNPVLIGEAGVGKTAIVEGLAQRIVKKDVPDRLLDKTIFSLNITSLISGAMYRGDFEERLEEILTIVKESQGRIILFIDEIHNIVGSGAGSGSMDTSNIIKPMLARGEILTIGATTIDEYKAHIEKDAALDRRFQKVLVEEPSTEASLSILRGIVSKYEQFHKVNIQDSALVEAVHLSARFLPHRKRPDVAIDIIDEASALVRMTMDQRPEEIEDLYRRISQQEAEILLLKKESDQLSQYRLNELEASLKQAQDELDRREHAYNKEKKRLDQISKLKIDLEVLHHQIEEAKQEADWDELSQLFDKRDDYQLRLEKLLEEEAFYPVKVDVGVAEVQEIVSQLAHMPKQKMNRDQNVSIDGIRSHLQEQFVGGDAIIQSITNQVIRSQSGLFKNERPLMAMVLAGLSGLGKSYLAELLASSLYDGPQSLIRIDLSEYSDAASTTKIIGSPPGYIGYESTNHLTEKIRTRPYSALLMENLNYAHPDVLALIKRIVTTGQLTDNKNREVDFSNTLLLATVDLSGQQDKESELSNLLHQQSLDDFDEVFYLDPFTEDELYDLLSLALDRLTERLAANQIAMSYDEEVQRLITEQVVKQADQLTAHQLNQYMKDYLATPIALLSLRGDLKNFDQLNLSVDRKGQELKLDVVRDAGEFNRK